MPKHVLHFPSVNILSFHRGKRVSRENFDAILRTAAARWFPMTAVTENIQAWLSRACGEMSAVDALVGFLRSQPIETQATPGLEWIQILIVDRDGTALTCGCLLVGWLSEFRDSRIVNVTANPSYRAIVRHLPSAISAAPGPCSNAMSDRRWRTLHWGSSLARKLRTRRRCRGCGSWAKSRRCRRRSPASRLLEV